MRSEERGVGVDIVALRRTEARNRAANVYGVAQASLSPVPGAVFTLRDDEPGAAPRRCTCPRHEQLRPVGDAVAIPPGAPARSPPPRASSRFSESGRAWRSPVTLRRRRAPPTRTPPRAPPARRRRRATTAPRPGRRSTRQRPG